MVRTQSSVDDDAVGSGASEHLEKADVVVQVVKNPKNESGFYLGYDCPQYVIDWTNMKFETRRCHSVGTKVVLRSCDKLGPWFNSYDMFRATA